MNCQVVKKLPQLTVTRQTVVRTNESEIQPAQSDYTIDLHWDRGGVGEKELG